MKLAWLVAASVLALSSVPLVAQTTAAPAAAPQPYGDWGVDLAARDLSVRPGADFVRHAIGKWLDTTTIPADRAETGAGLEVHERNQAALQRMITGNTTGAKYSALYNSFMDEAKVAAVGDAPLRAELARLNRVRSHRDMARFMGATNYGIGNSLFGIGPSADTANANINVLYIGQGGLGLPEREYYFAEQFKPQREAYRAFVERALRMTGSASPAAEADAVLAFETAVAQVSWKIVERRDIGKVNNPMSSAELARYAPGFDWAAQFAGLRVPAQKRMIVMENTAIRDIAALYARTPLATIKAWQRFHMTAEASPYLSPPYIDSRFQFIKSLSGTTQILPRWKRALTLVDSSLGELVGQDFVRAYFPPEAKARMEALVGNLKLAMAGRIENNAWMSPATKQAALEKLARMDVMVGYPDEFRDYSKLRIDPADLFGNVLRAREFNGVYDMADLGKPVDRRKWAMNPQEVNAYNSGLENKIVFPAGLLQPPFFNLKADDAVNYGAAGAIIGHEIIHGFDDQGRKIDAHGAVRDWWANGDGERFEARAKVLGEQFAKFEPVPGMRIDPELTMGENIADFAGLQIALDAWRKSLGGRPAPVIDGLTGEQRFFLSYAQAWRSKQRDDSVRSQMASDSHSPSPFRVLGPLPNIDDWYTAFGVTPQDPMYIPPEKRAVIW